jgi:hypothetical protein
MWGCYSRVKLTPLFAGGTHKVAVYSVARALDKKPDTGESAGSRETIAQKESGERIHRVGFCVHLLQGCRQPGSWDGQTA